MRQFPMSILIHLTLTGYSVEKNGAVGELVLSLMQPLVHTITISD